MATKVGSSERVSQEKRDIIVGGEGERAELEERFSTILVPGGGRVG